MIDAEQAVISALKSRKETVDRVISQTTSAGLDLCFVVTARRKKGN